MSAASGVIISMFSERQRRILRLACSARLRINPRIIIHVDFIEIVIGTRLLAHMRLGRPWSGYLSELRDRSCSLVSVSRSSVLACSALGNPILSGSRSSS
jgi:hypothetical protein